MFQKLLQQSQLRCGDNLLALMCPVVGYCQTRPDILCLFVSLSEGSKVKLDFYHSYRTTVTMHLTFRNSPTSKSLTSYLH